MTTYDMFIQKGERIGIQKGERIGIQKGEKIGIQKGEKRGELKKEFQAIKNMLLKGLEVKLIAEIMNISVEKVLKIKTEIEE